MASAVDLVGASTRSVRARRPVLLGAPEHEDIDSVLQPNIHKFRIAAGQKVSLRDFDPSYPGNVVPYEAAVPQLLRQLEKMKQLQGLMHAESKHALLIILQGLDASGKDGLMRLLLSGMNPGGSRVATFKQPTRKEKSHDFLWRVHSQVPAKGEVVVFNRSQYEDVLVVRVHQLIPPEICSNRYSLINDFERLLVSESHTTILKFLLHISKDEQLARFKRRLDDPARRWKISEADYQEREYWDAYIEAFEDMLHKTSSASAPWFVVPSNQKWFRDLVVSHIVTRALEELDMHLPEVAVDTGLIRQQYHAAEMADTPL